MAAPKPFFLLRAALLCRLLRRCLLLDSVQVLHPCLAAINRVVRRNTICHRPRLSVSDSARQAPTADTDMTSHTH